MKTFCILEQGNSIGDSITARKKEIFTTGFSDFYRLNWQRADDPNANFFKKGITWSEGRSYLYQEVPKNYDYYIFTDDDIEFESLNGDDVAKKIRDILKEYNPITGTFFDPNRWMFRDYSDGAMQTLEKKPAFPLSGYDLEVQIFSSDFAKTMFPVIFHGAAKSMWYSQWICYQLYPAKQLCFTGIRISNPKHNALHERGEKLLWLFNKDIKNKSTRIVYKSDVIRNNLKLFNMKPDKTVTRFNENQFGRIYDITNPHYLGREALMTKSYHERIAPYGKRWKLTSIYIGIELRKSVESIIRAIVKYIKRLIFK